MIITHSIHAIPKPYVFNMNLGKHYWEEKKHIYIYIYKYVQGPATVIQYRRRVNAFINICSVRQNVVGAV